MTQQTNAQFMDVLGWTSAHVLCCKGQGDEAVREYRKMDCFVLPTSLGTSFACFAVSTGCVEVVCAILEGPEKDLLPEREKRLMLMTSIINQRFIIFKLLLRKGFDRFVTTQHIRTLGNITAHTQLFVDTLLAWKLGDYTHLLTLESKLDGKFYEADGIACTAEKRKEVVRWAYHGSGLSAYTIIKALSHCDDQNAKDVVNDCRRNLNQIVPLETGNSTALKYAASLERWTMVRYISKNYDISIDSVRDFVMDGFVDMDVNLIESLLCTHYKFTLPHSCVAKARKFSNTEFLVYALRHHCVDRRVFDEELKIYTNTVVDEPRS